MKVSLIALCTTIVAAAKLENTNVRQHRNLAQLTVYEKDAMNLNLPIPQCHQKYAQKGGCAVGHAIQTFRGLTIDQCQLECSERDECLGVSYFKPNSSGASEIYKVSEGDCLLQSSTATSSRCDTDQVQLTFYAKKKESTCNVVPGTCQQKYTETGGCVNGKNIQKLHDKTVDECQQNCSDTNGCVGIEYFKKGTGNVKHLYKENDCTLSSGTDTKGCNANAYQLTFYLKKPEFVCDELVEEEYQDVADVRYDNQVVDNVGNQVDGYYNDQSPIRNRYHLNGRQHIPNSNYPSAEERRRDAENRQADAREAATIRADQRRSDSEERTTQRKIERGAATKKRADQRKKDSAQRKKKRDAAIKKRAAQRKKERAQRKKEREAAAKTKAAERKKARSQKSDEEAAARKNVLEQNKKIEAIRSKQRKRDAAVRQRKRDAADRKRAAAAQRKRDAAASIEAAAAQRQRDAAARSNARKTTTRTTSRRTTTPSRRTSTPSRRTTSTRRRRR